eukprot:TCONS_00028330-protein
MISQLKQTDQFDLNSVTKQLERIMMRKFFFVQFRPQNSGNVCCRIGRSERKYCLRRFNWRKIMFPFIQLFLKLSGHGAITLPIIHQPRLKTRKINIELVPLRFHGCLIHAWCL